MIDQFKAKTTGNKLLLQRGLPVLIGERTTDGGKPKLIDMAFGDWRAIRDDLINQGYEVEVI